MKNFISKNKIKFIILLFVFLLVTLVVIFNVYHNEKNKGDEVTEYESGEPIDPYNYLSEGEEVVSSSEAKVLQEEQKSLDQYRLLNFKMVMGNEKNRVLFELKNESNETILGQELVIYLYGKEHKVIDTIYVYIPDMIAGSSLAVNGITKVDLKQVIDNELVYVKN